MKARIICSYCSTVFNSSFICLLRHWVILRAFRRNQFTVAFFRVLSARALLDLFLWKLFDIWNGNCDSDCCNNRNNSCDSNCCNSCDSSWSSDCCNSCNSSWDSSCCNKCDNCNISCKSDSYRVFRFFEDLSDRRRSKITIARSFDKFCNCLSKYEQQSQCWRKQSNRLF